MADTMDAVTHEETSAGTTERVGPFALTVATAELSTEAAERWTRRAEILTNWLVARWRREQEHAEGTAIDGQGRSDEDGDFRGPDLN